MGFIDMTQQVPPQIPEIESQYPYKVVLGQMKQGSDLVWSVKEVRVFADDPSVVIQESVRIASILASILQQADEIPIDKSRTLKI